MRIVYYRKRFDGSVDMLSMPDSRSLIVPYKMVFLDEDINWIPLPAYMDDRLQIHYPVSIDYQRRTIIYGSMVMKWIS